MWLLVVWALENGRTCRIWKFRNSVVLIWLTQMSIGNAELLTWLSHKHVIDFQEWHLVTSYISTSRMGHNRPQAAINR